MKCIISLFWHTPNLLYTRINPHNCQICWWVYFTLLFQFWSYGISLSLHHWRFLFFQYVQVNTVKVFTPICISLWVFHSLPNGCCFSFKLFKELFSAIVIVGGRGGENQRREMGNLHQIKPSIVCIQILSAPSELSRMSSRNSHLWKRT